MGVTTERYIRKPLYVDAVRVKAENFDDIVRWCQGEVQTSEVPGTGTTKKYIKVRVHNPKNPRQTQAFIGDWILYTDRGYKVYTNKAFRAAFNLVEGVEPKEQEIPPPEEEQRATAEEIREKLPHAQDRRPQIGEKVGETFSTSDTPIESVAPTAPPQDDEKTTPVESAVEIHETPQGEPHEYVEATPGAIADAVNEQQPVDSPDESTPLVPPHTPIAPVESVNDEDVRQEMTGQAQAEVEETMTTAGEPVSEQPPEVAAEGKMVISLDDQRQLGPDGVRELLSSGEAVLEQDLAESA